MSCCCGVTVRNVCEAAYRCLASDLPAGTCNTCPFVRRCKDLPAYLKFLADNVDLDFFINPDQEYIEKNR